MKTLLLMGALALFTLPATAALAVPLCDSGNMDVLNSNGVLTFNAIDEAQKAEQMLRSHGIDAHMTRFWNGCIQTFVKENGHDVMKFYNPDTYAEIPVN